MRRLFVLSLSALMTTLSVIGCSAILGLEEKPINDGFTDDIEAGRADRRVETLDATPSTTTDADASSPPTGDSGNEGGFPLIPCIGTMMAPAFFCDGFEGATLKTEWTPMLTNGGIAVVKASGGTTSHSGVNYMSSGFDTNIPATGNAYLSYTRPNGAGPLALRFWYFLQNDGWQGGRHTIAELNTPAGPVKLVFKVAASASDGTMEVDVPGGPTLNLGPSSKSQWACYQLVATGTTLDVYRDSATKMDGTAFTQPIQGVDLGMQWAGGSATGASRFNEYDDVVISPALVGCN